MISKSVTYESLRKSSMPGGPSPPRRRLLLLLCEPESAGPEPLFPAAASSVSPPMTRVVRTAVAEELPLCLVRLDYVLRWSIVTNTHKITPLFVDFG